MFICTHPFRKEGACDYEFNNECLRDEECSYKVNWENILDKHKEKESESTSVEEGGIR